MFFSSMKPTSIHIVLTQGERQELEKQACSSTAPHREVVRAKAILGLADGKAPMKLESELGLRRKLVRQWGSRFEQRMARETGSRVA